MSPAGRSRVVLDLGRLVAAQRADHARHDHDEAVGAGVHDARLAEDGKLVRPALDGLGAGLQRALQDVGQEPVLRGRLDARVEALGLHVCQLLSHAVGHRADRREHGALRGVADRVVGGVGRAGQGGRHEDRVDQLAGARGQLLGGAAHDLGQDHAAVAARAEQRGTGHGGHHLVAADLVDVLPVDAIELVDHRAQGHRHVVARVAVGDREDVQVVDLLATALELRVALATARRKRTMLGSGMSMFYTAGGPGGCRGCGAVP